MNTIQNKIGPHIVRYSFVKEQFKKGLILAYPYFLKVIDSDKKLRLEVIMFGIFKSQYDENYFQK